MDLGEEDVPPQLEEPSDVFGGIDGTGLKVELLQPWLSGADEVDDLQVLPETETNNDAEATRDPTDVGDKSRVHCT